MANQRVEIRHGEIGENDFRGRLQMIQESAFGVHAHGARFIPGMPQGVQDELGIGWIVFNHQNAKRYGHGPASLSR
jgi:hypothetical protein